MPDCVFCQIAAGKIPAHKVYEDEGVVAFLDVNPIGPGHTLVIPKNHIGEVQEMGEDLHDHVMEVVQRMARTIKQKINPKRIGLLVHGFDIPDHAHIHVVPMNSGQELSLSRGPKTSDAEMADSAKRLKD